LNKQNQWQQATTKRNTAEAAENKRIVQRRRHSNNQQPTKSEKRNGPERNQGMSSKSREKQSRKTKRAHSCTNLQSYSYSIQFNKAEPNNSKGSNPTRVGQYQV
jgi:hypothetical protein